MMTIQISGRKDKRFKAVFDNRKTVHFGSNGNAYIDHNNDDKKTAYLARHKANEDWDDPMTAGALSRWLYRGGSTPLLNPPTASGIAYGMRKH